MNSPLVPSQLLTRQALWDPSAQVAGVGTYVLHLPSNDLEVDDRLLELSELTRATFSGRPEDVYAHLHPDDVDDVVAAVQHATTTGGNYHAEYRVVLPGGGHRWVSARGKVLTDEHGTPTALVGAAYDVTEAREAVAATVAVLETMAVGYLAMDPDWVITHLVLGPDADDHDEKAVLAHRLQEEGEFLLHPLRDVVEVLQDESLPAGDDGAGHPGQVPRRLADRLKFAIGPQSDGHAGLDLELALGEDLAQLSGCLEVEGALQIAGLRHLQHGVHMQASQRLA